MYRKSFSDPPGNFEHMGLLLSPTLLCWLADGWMDGSKADPVLAYLCAECFPLLLLRQRIYNLFRNARIIMYAKIMFDMRKLIGKTCDSGKEF